MNGRAGYSGALYTVLCCNVCNGRAIHWRAASSIVESSTTASALGLQYGTVPLLATIGEPPRGKAPPHNAPGSGRWPAGVSAVDAHAVAPAVVQHRRYSKPGGRPSLPRCRGCHPPASRPVPGESNVYWHYSNVTVLYQLVLYQGCCTLYCSTVQYSIVYTCTVPHSTLRRVLYHP